MKILHAKQWLCWLSVSNTSCFYGAFGCELAPGFKATFYINQHWLDLCCSLRNVSPQTTTAWHWLPVALRCCWVVNILSSLSLRMQFKNSPGATRPFRNLQVVASSFTWWKKKPDWSTLDAMDKMLSNHSPPSPLLRLSIGFVPVWYVRSILMLLVTHHLACQATLPWHYNLIQTFLRVN